MIKEILDSVNVSISLFLSDVFHLSFINYGYLFYILAVPLFIFIIRNSHGILTNRSDLLFVNQKDMISKMIVALPNFIVFCIFSFGLAALAKPYWGGEEITKSGQGSQIVITMDRSVSMSDELRGTNGLKKNEVASDLIKSMVKRNLKDMFGFVIYSNSGIMSMPITSNQNTIAASVKALSGVGLAKTNVYGALKTSIGMFSDAPYLSDRAIVLFTDGASRMDSKSKEQVKDLLKQENVSLYWVYINDSNGTSLKQSTDMAIKENGSIPAVIEFRDFLLTLKTKVKTFEATNLVELEQAVEEINTQERHIVVWKEQSQSVDMSGVLAFICSLLVASLIFFRMLGW